MEVRAEAGIRGQGIEEEFCFLLCHNCKAESKCPKLLSCLHTICSGCMESHQPTGQCPICQDSHSEETNLRSVDNLFFESLQRRISIYQNIIQGGENAVCNRCREPADFWCFECEQLICTRCFEAHQWFVKHEARAVEELRKESAKDFLNGTRKSNNLFCPNPTHRTPSLTSIYCRGCAKPICCTCALLDSNHKDQYCAISSEIQQRQEELAKITGDLKTQEKTFSEAHDKIQAAIGHLEQVKKETQELIHSRVQIMVEQIQAQEKELLETVEGQYKQSHEQMAGKLRHLNSMLQRIQNGEVLVEKLQHYASDQEVLEMHTFIREALEHLHKEKPLNLQAGVKEEEFKDCKDKLQALFVRVTEEKVFEAADLKEEGKKEEPIEPTIINTDSDSQDEKLQKQDQVPENSTETQGQHTLVHSRKRKSAHANKVASRKVIKKESEEGRKHKMNNVLKQPQASTSRKNQLVRADVHPNLVYPTLDSEKHSTVETNSALPSEEQGFMVISSIKDGFRSFSTISSDESMDHSIPSDQESEEQLTQLLWGC